MVERDWREIFQVQTVDNFTVETEVPGDCNAGCLDAKELKCVCRCGGKNHGANLPKGIQPLDEFNEPQGQELEIEVMAA